MPQMNTIIRKNLNLKGTKEPIIHKGYYQLHFKEKTYFKKISSLAKQLIHLGEKIMERHILQRQMWTR
jgi:hypothetical protein